LQSSDGPITAHHDARRVCLVEACKEAEDVGPKGGLVHLGGHPLHFGDPLVEAKRHGQLERNRALGPRRLCSLAELRSARGHLLDDVGHVDDAVAVRVHSCKDLAIQCDIGVLLALLDYRGLGGGGRCTV